MTTPSEHRRNRGSAAQGRLLKESGLVLVSIGVLVLLWLVYSLFATGLAEQASQSTLKHQFQRDQRSSTTKSSSSPTTGGSATTTGKGDPSSDKDTVSTLSGSDAGIPPGQAIAQLIIPKIGLDKYVVQGTDEADLMKGPGHYLGSALPGQWGNVGIAGHRTTYGAPFFDLGNLRKGDLIRLINTSGKQFVYTVVRTWTVDPSDGAVLNSDGTPELTLTTCNPRFEAINRLVVRADLTSITTKTGKNVTAETTPQNPPSGVKRLYGPPSKDSTIAGLGSGSSSGWFPFAGYFVLVVLGWILTRVSAARRRGVGKLLVLTVGTLICLIPLWFAFENLARVMPQGL